jgi:hypothetical protein
MSVRVSFGVLPDRKSIRECDIADIADWLMGLVRDGVCYSLFVTDERDVLAIMTHTLSCDLYGGAHPGRWVGTYNRETLKHGVIDDLRCVEL